MAPVPTSPRTPDDDPETYVGLDVRAAEQQARDRGWTTVRTLPPDAVITMEYVAGRLNFTVRDGSVVRSWKG
ncbi:I78 family peptidase inhibitor [Streptomyces sp. TRM 70361]|uniref:I78 family peptidase inhibitor n=1 Tax=Streptomyces sp. TRM 70361 TaxID=3116553 RepID=UPI002E7B3E4D|nr:I78 family peptidase inhibitor [Streptomyces sp. TRM 70361]MEE1943254.1 I78 family peptidase inhibitor [Streptomyces sp. TRM 70361]